MKKLKDKNVIIEFFDHSQDSPEYMFCRAWGIITDIKEHHIVLTCWDLPNEVGDTRTSNQRNFSILKSAIQAIYIFGKGRKTKYK